MGHIRDLHPEYVFPPSCTTRAMRPGEVEGRDHYFVEKTDFERRIAAGEFLEWAEYGENYYGSLREEILPALEQGKIVVAELDVQGVRSVQQALPPEQFVSIYVDAGSWDELERRVRARGPMSDSELVKRKKRYEDELTYKNEATYVVPNAQGQLDEAKKRVEAIMNALHG